MEQPFQYENIQIGNFLMSIGYHLRDKNIKMPASMNLYQQLPKKDYTVGDLFGELTGKFFIIEFKRDTKSFQKERDKPQRKKLQDQLQLDRNRLNREISNRCHLICFPKRVEGEFDYELRSYLSIDPVIFETNLNIRGVSNFIDQLSANQVGGSYEEIEQYFSLLNSCAGFSGFSASGILVNFNKEGMKYVEFQNLRVLKKEIKLAIKYGISTSRGMRR